MDIRTVMIEEFREELASTRKVLERIPEDKLAYKPHDKSMSLGRLAMRIATLPGGIAGITRADEFDFAKNTFTIPEPADRQQVLAALDHSAGEVEKLFSDTSLEASEASWRLLMGDRELIARPRYKIWRAILLNHWYHHRAQLTVYLRMLDVPIPALYGPSADENPFQPPQA